CPPMWLISETRKHDSTNRDPSTSLRRFVATGWCVESHHAKKGSVTVTHAMHVLPCRDHLRFLDGFGWHVLPTQNPLLLTCIGTLGPPLGMVTKAASGPRAPSSVRRVLTSCWRRP